MAKKREGFMRRKAKEEEVEAVEKVLDVDAAMQGSMVFKDPVNLRINGSFVGDLVTKGSLSIGANANIKAKIDGEKITIAGKVEGDITASGEIELKAPAKVYGDIKTPSLSIEKGVLFQGSCNMASETKNQSPKNDRLSVMTADELAGYLEVDESMISDWASSGKLPGYKENNRWYFQKNKVDEWIASERVK